MDDVSSQPTKRKRKAVVVEILDKSDDDVFEGGKKQISTQPELTVAKELPSQDTSQFYHTQQQLPKFHTRNLERILKKQRAWSEPLPTPKKLFFLAVAPKKPSDLSVNPRQLNKLRLLLTTEEDQGRVLLVTGPAGCGKSSSIRVLAKELNIEILKWEHSESVDLVCYGENCHIREESEMHSFITFLRSCVLPFTCIDRCSKKARRKLCHIEDLPFSAYLDPSEFRRIIYPYLHVTKQIVVFDLTTRNSSWSISPKRMFPKHFINSLNIYELNFYPVASTFMRKALRRAVDLMGFNSRLSAQDYRAIEKISNGDLRCGINIIQYSLLCSQKDFYLPNFFETGSSDELFHMLGSLLYAKRQECSCLPEIESAVREDLRRPPPTREINDTLSMSKASADTVMMFLHEHEPNFSGSLAGTRKVLEAMSLSDVLLSRWESYQVGQEYAAQVCACVTLFYNYRANRVARGFYGYDRPKWFRLAEKKLVLQRELDEVMPRQRLHQRHCADIDIPYLALMKASLTGSQYSLVTYLTRPWTFSWSSDRELWNHQIATQSSYRMAQFRENSSDITKFCGLQNEESDEESFVIEDSEDDLKSDDSFDEPVTFQWGIT